MSKIIDDAHIHDGHRARMRYKLLTHGQRIFDTYELLEMLLYQVVPYKDTNPISKRLLRAFGGLDGVFKADKEELIKVNGVGERTAEYLKLVDMLGVVIGSEIVDGDSIELSGFDDIGGIFVDYFLDKEEPCVVAMFLDSSMNLLSFKKLYDLDFDSGGVKPKTFIDEAIKSRATLVISAHNHPHGLAYPLPGDRATYNAITEALSLAGFIHAEHYLVSKYEFVGIGTLRKFDLKIHQMPRLADFFESKKASLGEENKSSSPSKAKHIPKDIPLIGCSYNKRDFDYFKSLLAFSLGDDAFDAAQMLLQKYKTIENVFTASENELKCSVGEKCAFYLKLLAYVTSRRRTDSFVFGKTHNNKEIESYLTALFLGDSVEKAYLITFDHDGRTTGCHLIGEGTVCSSEIVPRKAVEVAVSNSSKYVSFAHNHPRGKLDASNEDMNVTKVLAAMFANCEISFRKHYIVAGQGCTFIKLETPYKSDNCFI